MFSLKTRITRIKSIAMVGGAWAALVLGWPQTPAGAQDGVAPMARAEQLYYEARFGEALALLTPLDKGELPVPLTTTDRATIKLQLALVHLGLNDPVAARERLVELLELDPGYTLNPQLYAPKVVELFHDARVDFEATRCRSFCRSASSLLDQADAEGLLAQVRAAPACECMAATVLDAAEFFFQRGEESHGLGDHAEAAQDFRRALTFNSAHEAARERLSLIEAELTRLAGEILDEWQDHLDGGEYSLATDSYRKLLALDLQDRLEPELNRMRGQYQLLLDPILESWRQACADHDIVLMEALERDVARLLPEPAFGDEALRGMTCAGEGCLQVRTDVAIQRVTSRISPDLGFNPARGTSVLRVQIRVDENGDVTTRNIGGGNASVEGPIRTALGQWKFQPAVIGNERRCFETELSFLVNP